MVEQRPFKPKVVGPIPTAPTNISELLTHPVIAFAAFSSVGLMPGVFISFGDIFGHDLDRLPAM